MITMRETTCVSLYWRLLGNTKNKQHWCGFTLGRLLCCLCLGVDRAFFYTRLGTLQQRGVEDHFSAGEA
jgi:hypothetical protein